ncbi:MAG: ATP-binding cassette domain-containing protein [Clostridia bacterium]|nr:ATP-binding cassette domain-containing protein [Clostridia bacterium]
MIELVNLEKIYPLGGKSVVALSGIDLTISDGDIFGIIGLSGAGKSTLVRCINFLERPTRGKVIVDGTDLSAITPKQLREVRRNIGMIFQNFNLLEQRTVEKNVRFPLELAKTDKKTADARVDELLEIVGLSDKKKAYPSQLSGGQKQRVAIARALATNPKYLLCDEATSALDPNTTASILSLLKKINSELGITIVVITHEMKVIESVCKKVAVIDSSRIAEVGEVSEVFSNPKSEIAKELVIPDLIRSIKNQNGYKFRLVFNGESSNTPAISALALEKGIAVNIVYADTKMIDGKIYGHLVFTLVGGREEFEQTKIFLEKKGIKYFAEEDQ